jgi:filamentous hemagglutinin
VTIDGTGLDTSTADYTNILARAAQVNAGIWAKDLKMVTGANDISASNSAAPTVTATATGTGTTPAYALDVAALGGMYAGKIYLIGTEAGLGVRNSGVIGATAGDVVLTANGILTHSGSIYASGNTTITTQGDINTSGSIAAQGNTTLSAQGANTQGQASQVNATSTSVLASGVDSSGAIGTTGALQISSAGGSALHGQVASGADTSVTATSVDLSGATLSAQNATLTASTQGIHATGANVAVKGTLNALAQTTLTTDGATVNANQLNLAAHDLSNVGGKLLQSGTGDLTINLPGNLDNTGGTIATNSQNLSLSASTLTNAAGGTIQHAGTGTLAITDSTLNGNGGTIVSNGSLSLQGGVMDLTNASTGAKQIAITGTSLKTEGGQIVQSGTTADATIAVTGAINNTGGTIASNAGASVTSASLTNTNGKLQSTGGNLAIQTGSLDNTAGSIYSSGNLNATTSSLTNTGNVYAVGDSNVAVTGAVTNSGTIAAQGNETLTAGSLASSKTSLLAAGLKSDGTLGTATPRNLQVTTTGATSAQGQNLASGDLSIDASSVDLTQSITSAANIALTASSGDISTRGATVVTPGTLTVRANTSNVQAWDNSAIVAASTPGTVQAGQLDVHVANLNNAGGEIVQTGSASSTIAMTSPTGTLNNVAGRMASNGQDLTLAANTLDNTQGKVQHAGTGTLAINAANLTGTDGTIVGNGTLNIQGGAVNLTRATTTAQHVNIQANSLDNSSGRITQASSSGTAQVSVAGTLANTAGTISSNAGLTLSAANVDNRGGKLTAVGALSATATQAITNNAVGQTTGGVVAANGDVSLIAASLDNTDGTLIAVNGQLSTTTTGATTNTRGTVQSGDTLALQSASLDNSAGLIQSAGTATVTTQSLNNQNARLLAVGALTVQGVAGANAATLDNTGGLMRSLDTLTVKADSLLNKNTYAVDANGVASNQGLEGKNIVFKTSILDNSVGAIRADKALTITAANSLTNSQGLINAGGALSIQDAASAVTPAATGALMVTNTHGVLNAGVSNTVQAQGITGDGRILSQGDLSLNLSSDFTNSGDVIANGNATVQTTGKIINNAKLQAGQTLHVSAANLDNTATGEISATSTQVQVSDTVNNRGLIDGTTTRIDAGTVNNTGTGRIYGDDLSIGAVTLNNGAETVAGVTKAAVIAARNNLQLGVQTLNNKDGASIFSVGDMAIGGALDNQGKATGAAGTITNSAASIESLGSMAIQTAALNNMNPNLSWTVTAGTFGVQQTDFFTTAGTFNSQEGAWQTNGPIVNIYGKEPNTAAPLGIVMVEDEDGNYFPWQTYVKATVLNGDSPYSTPALKSAYLGPDVVANTSVSIVDTDGVVHQAATQTLNVPTDTAIWTAFGLSAPNTPAPSMQRPVGTYTEVCVSGFRGETCSTQYQESPDAAAWDAAAAPWVALQSKINDLRTAVNASAASVAGYRTYATADDVVTVKTSTPGNISSGGQMRISASANLLNDNSNILAGGALNITGVAVNNNSTAISYNTVLQGTAYNWGHWDSGCGSFFGGCDYSYNAYKGSAFTETITKTTLASASRVEQNVTPQLDGARVQAQQTIAALPVLAAASKALADGPLAVGKLNVSFNSGDPVSPALAAAKNVSVATSNPSSTNSITKIVSVPVGVALPNSSLFNINTTPSAHFLVETDPRFTNYKSWLSSDYVTAQVALDPNVTQKRLGDGFYEQKLIREQVAQLTGKRFLGDYTSDQQEYQALMDSGLTFAKAYNLREGIALTAAQVALLTTDIVWLLQESVTLPDGTVTQALVPHVYAAVRDGDLKPSGALLTGDSVNIQTTADLTNSGTILGRKTVQIDANNINNLLGQIGGSDVSLKAAQDINNVGGTITADNSLVAIAGRDINVTSTTQSSSGSGGNYSFSQSGVDRVAVLQVKGSGVLLASAGNNLNITAAKIAGGGDVLLDAANSVNLKTLQSTQTNNFGAGDADNHLLTSQSKDVGSSVSAGGNLQVTAGQDINAKAADLSAQNKVSLTAQNNIILDAGQTTSSLDSALTTSSSGFLSSSTTKTTTQASAATAQVNTINGQNVSVQAANNLVSVGTAFNGQKSIDVGGQNNTLLYAAVNQQQSATTTQSTSGFAGITLSDKTTTDSKAQSTSIATKLISNEKVQIGVGNKTELQGTEVQAKEISFVKNNANGAGELILGGSTDTTQTSHTEKDVTAGVYQSSKGNGSTVQTLNQTSLNGNVTFDQSLKITVQIPKDVRATPGGQALQSQLQALSSTPLANTPQGLAYMEQLKANPNVQWDKVALANEHWSYDQSGLTPAGAALLSIAVAAYTGGMGSELLGGTSATAATATTAATSATLAGSASLAASVNAGFSALAAQTAVAMVNNGGDIGKTLEQLGSEQSIKNILIAMVTAGVGKNVAGQGGSAIAAQTVTGCVTGAVSGAGCEQGAKTAAILSGAGEAYRSIVGYEANAGPGENRNGAGQTTQTYLPGTDGRQIPADQGMNVIGFNDPNKAGSLGAQGGILRIMSKTQPKNRS